MTTSAIVQYPRPCWSPSWGYFYTLCRTRHVVGGPINKRLLATFECHEAMFRQLHDHAVRRGYGNKRSFFLADGADHIWRLQEKYFPRRYRASTGTTSSRSSGRLGVACTARAAEAPPVLWAARARSG